MSKKECFAYACRMSLLVVILIFSSCTDEDKTEVSSETKIYNFYFSATDSLPGIENYSFTIDQKNGLIFNKDSLPFQSNVTKLVPKISFYATPLSWTINDSLSWNGSDSLDFSKPVKFTIFSSDGTSQKEYLIKVLVHQTKPDAISWRKSASTYSPSFQMLVGNMKTIAYKDALWMYGLSSNSLPKLYVSKDDGISWKETEISGLTLGTQFSTLIQMRENLYVYNTNKQQVYTSSDATQWSAVDFSRLNGECCFIVGEINDRFCGIVKDSDNYLRFFTTADFQIYEYSTKVVPNGFSVTGQVSVNNETRTGVRSLVVGLGYGISYPEGENEFLYNGQYLVNTPVNMLWATMDGLNWTNLTFNAVMDNISINKWEELLAQKTFTGKRTGAVMFVSDYKLFLSSGWNLDTKTFEKDILVSKDGGMTWTEVDECSAFPEEYKARMSASVVIDASNYITIYGGSTYETSFSDMWRGRISKLGFVE